MKWKQYLNNKLCIFCEVTKHIAKDCTKPSSLAAKGQAATIISIPADLSKDLGSTVNSKK